ncbi:hypothetical protein ACLMNJ_16335 [Streptomyces seoulensis]
MGLPSYRNLEDGGVEAAEYRVWVRAPKHVRPVDGVAYDQVPTEPLPPKSAVRETFGEGRPSGWVLAKVREGRVPARGVLHAPGCEGAPLLSVERVLNVAGSLVTQLCSLCGCALELTWLLQGFDQVGDLDSM